MGLHSDSQYGGRFFDLDRGIMRRMDLANGRRQYSELVEEGKINPKEQTFDQWWDAGNYDKNDWSDRSLKEFGF